MAWWLVKTEPETYSIDDLIAEGSTLWEGVRNYQARNYLRGMKVGDQVLIYHSNEDPPRVMGIGKVIGEAEPDPTQFDPRSDYFDEKATRENPRWFAPRIGAGKRFKHPVPIGALREERSLAKMALLQRGSRLSVHPVSEREFRTVVRLGGNVA